MSKKEVYQNIAKAYALKAMSPQAYSTIVYNIRNKIRPTQSQKEGLLRDLGSPYVSGKTTTAQYKRIVTIISEKIRLDDEVNKVFEVMRPGYSPER